MSAHQKWAMPKLSWIAVIFFVVAASGSVRAADVAPHLVGMAQSLVRQIEEADYASLGNSELRGRIADILRQSRLRSWAGSPPKIATDPAKLATVVGLTFGLVEHRSALDQLLGSRSTAEQNEALSTIIKLTGNRATLSELGRKFRAALAEEVASMQKEATLETGNGTGVEIEWDPQSSSTLVRVQLGKDEGEVVLHGATPGRIVEGALVFNVEADAAPVTRITPAMQAEINADVFGPWTGSDGSTWTIRGGKEIEAAAQNKADPTAQAQEQIEAAKRQIAALEKNKVYVWVDGQGGEVVQKKFKKLQPPFRYDRVRSESIYSAEMAALRDQITAAEAALKLPPVRQHDPLNVKNNPGKGRAVEIAVEESSGRRYRYDEASFDGKRLTASRTLRDTRDISDLPDWVIKGLIGSFSPPEWIELEVWYNPRDKSARLEGLWWRLNVTYDPAYNDISGIHTPYNKPLTLQRAKDDNLLRIVDLEISYKGAEQLRLQLEARVAIAQGDLQRAQDEVRTLNAEYEARRATTGRLHSAMIDADARYTAATQAVRDYVPADAAKSAAYARLEKRRAALSRRLEMLYEGIIANAKNTVPESAFESYRQLEAELAETDAQIERMGVDLGFVAERARLQKAAHEAFDAKSRADIALLGAVSVQDLAHGRLDDAELRLIQLQEKLGKAELALANFDAGAIRISGAEAEEGAAMRYKVEAWDPSEVLDFLDAEIAGLTTVLARASAIRRETRAQFLAAQNESGDAQLRLADGIMKSAVAQGVTEYAFNAADVVDKFNKFGPIGAVGETAKKVAEAVLLGPPTFYEPSLAPEIMTGNGGPFSDIRANLNDAFEYSKKRAKKSGGFSLTANYIVSRFITARDPRLYLELIGQETAGSVATGFRAAGRTEAQAAVQALSALEKSREKLKKAVSEGLLRNFVGLTRLSFKAAFIKVVTSPQAGGAAKSVGRDLAKMATKKAMAEWLEGVALAEYIAAETEARLRTQIFLAASSVYWDAYDDLRARTEERREILRQYDAKNHMVILKDEPFKEGADLLIVLRDASGKPVSAPGRAISVSLGGKPAQRVGGEQLFFRIAASDLAHDGAGGVTLAVSVGE
jgi:hypothetical protein